MKKAQCQMPNDQPVPTGCQTPDAERPPTVNLKIGKPSDGGVSLRFMGKLIALLTRLHGDRKSMTVEQFNHIINLAGSLEGFWCGLAPVPKKTRRRGDAERKI